MMVPLSQDIITTPGLSSPNLLPPFSHLMDGKGLPRDVHVRCAISPSTVFRVAAVLVLIDGPEKSRYCKKYIWSCWGLEVACFQALSVSGDQSKERGTRNKTHGDSGILGKMLDKMKACVIKQFVPSEENPTSDGRTFFAFFLHDSSGSIHLICWLFVISANCFRFD